MTDSQTIICPHCKKEIPLTEAMFHQIREKVESELGAEYDKKLADLTKKEQGVVAKDKLLTEREEKISEEVEKLLRGEREQLKTSTRAKVKEEHAAEVKDLEEQLSEKDEKLKQALETERQLRKRARDLDEKERTLDLEFERKLDESRKQIMSEAQKTLDAQYQLTIAEKDKRLKDALDANQDLQRKLQQGSQQTQGEVLEIQLEDLLRAKFPVDEIDPVPKGIRGADILHRVRSQFGQHCGIIIWESKRTKAWNDGWLQKIKDDQRAVKSDLAVIVTISVPEGFKNFDRLDGVWVTEYACALNLASALRLSLIEISAARAAATGKNEKMELLYGYLSGPYFKQRIEGIVESFKSMREDLDQEKRAMTRMWAKREKQIDRVIGNTSGLYGDMQGIIGSTLPQIESLELKPLPGPSAEDEDNNDSLPKADDSMPF